MSNNLPPYCVIFLRYKDGLGEGEEITQKTWNICTFLRKENHTPLKGNMPSGDTILWDGKHKSGSRNDRPKVIPSKETYRGTHSHSKEDNLAFVN